MLYHSFTVGDREYKARLNAKGLVELEKKMGTSPINMFMAMSQNENQMPELESLIAILHASLQSMEHGITLDKTYDIYDGMVDEGKTIVDLLDTIVKIFDVSGMIPKQDTKSKNA